jgi:mono/diheme cytochrome c family protein
MDASLSAFLGLVFLFLGFAAVLLMFRIWGYPFDAERHQSEAPQWLVLVHRCAGVAYVVLYLVMMYHMVPRLFLYQVEFAPRTVAHLMLGVSIGFLLVMKLLIIRFFGHFKSMLPYIGMTILWCTVMLVSLSVPFAFKETFWSRSAVGGSVYSAENLERIKRLLPVAKLPQEAPVEQLATEHGLRAGRNVLLTQCVVCHDLKTILVRPRTPGDWVRTVERMAKKPVIGRPLEEADQWAVATYLIAISPDLQMSAKQRRVQQRQAEEARSALVTAIETTQEVRSVNLATAKTLFAETCSQCHELSEVDGYPLTTAADIRELMERMVENGLEATEGEMEQIIWYMGQVYGKETK